MYAYLVGLWLILHGKKLSNSQFAFISAVEQFPNIFTNNTSQLSVYSCTTALFLKVKAEELLLRVLDEKSIRHCVTTKISRSARMYAVL